MRWWTFAQVTEQATTATGRLMNTTQRQLAASVNAPPSSGPTALPIPASPMIRPPASPALRSGSAA
jgi:hypothetical protein